MNCLFGRTYILQLINNEVGSFVLPKIESFFCFLYQMDIQILVPDKIYAITFDGLLFVGLYKYTDEVHHFIDVYGLSNTTEKATFSKQCTFYGPFEPDIELHTIIGCLPL